MRDRSTRESEETRALTLYGRTISRATAIYTVGLAAIVPFGILTLAVSTRYLSPADYGRLAILVTVAAGVTTLGSLGTLQGTTHWVYGVAGEGDVDISDVAGGTAPISEKRRIMGTGLTLTLVTSVALVLVGVAAAAPLSRLCLGTDSYSEAARWAALSGATGSPWRFILQVFRFERRPVAFSLVSLLRPAFVLVGTFYALRHGDGISGVLGSIALGTVAATLVSFAMARTVFVPAASPALAAEIYRRGAKYVPMSLGLFVSSNIDVFVLAYTVSPRELGLWRVATRIAQFPTYLVHAYMMAWVPMERSPVGQANKSIKGRWGFASLVYTFLVILSLALFVATSLSADLLIHVAGRRFIGAAAFVPYATGAAVAVLIFYGFFRVAILPWRYFSFTVLTLGGAATTTLVGGPLAAAFGPKAYGVAAVASALWTTAVLIALNRRTPEPIPLQWRRMASAVVLAAATVAVGTSAAFDGAWRAVWIVMIGCVGAWATVRLDIVPWQRVTIVGASLRGLIPDAPRRRRLIARVPGLPAHERAAVRRLVADRGALADVAVDSGAPPELLAARLVRALRRLDDTDHAEASPLDVELGTYLLGDTNTSERDDQALALAGRGASLLEIHELEERFALLRRAPRREWRRLDARSAAGA